MPPSPAMRYSIGRELKGENRKTGHSLESRTAIFREKDDDLAMFNEMQMRESQHFLLQSNDGFDDIFSTKLGYFSDHKLGISMHTRGESSELLNGDGEKNDYDWLLTPPETPLFPSLDNETPEAILTQRGRPRSQPITISRSSTMEKSQRSSRGSASPNRISPSPRSGNNSLQSREGPSSAPHWSSTHNIRQASPSRRQSPAPNKSSMSLPRSLTRGSGGKVSQPLAIRSASPVKTNRGNSASPKIMAWQTNIPGFPMEAPPNLRTSISDRPPSFARGFSPASRNGKGSSSRSGRQSMSPTASRSVSSSQSHDRDQLSTHNKGSVVSSGDEDVDSLQSIRLDNTDYLRTKRVTSFPNNKSPTLSKTPIRTLLSSSAPKRSFDSALRQSNKKGPQNMFRPLLSSVPSSTFYAGKASISNCAIASRNSSVTTTSSNTSSDLGTFGLHETKGIDSNLDDADGPHDDLFVFDEGGALTKDTDGVDIGSVNILKTSRAAAETSEFLEFEGGCVELDPVDDILLCSICGNRYDQAELMCDLNICRDCRKKSSVEEPSEAPAEISSKIFDKPGLLEKIELLETVPQNLVLFESSSVKNESPINGTTFPSPIDNGLSSMACVYEGSGISILLKRSSSNKGTVFQGRSVAAIGVSYDDPLYMRDISISTRSSIGQVSASASSSMDLGSSRQTEAACLQRQLSGKKLDNENYRHEISKKHQRTGSSSLDVSTGSQVECENPLHLEDGTKASLSDVEYSNSFHNGEEESQKDVRISSDERVPTITTTTEECTAPVMLNNFSLHEVEIVVDVEIQSLSDNDSTAEVENIGVLVVASSESEDDTPESLALSPDKEDSTTLSTMKPQTLDQSSTIHEEESTKLRRSLTMEEATETILFCNSIVQNLAYEAAAIAIERERSMELEIPLPKPHLLFPTWKEPSRGQTLTKKSQKNQQKRVETESITVPAYNLDDEKHVNAFPTRIVGIPSKGNSTKPPPSPPPPPIKIESKCNCSIM